MTNLAQVARRFRIPALAPILAAGLLIPGLAPAGNVFGPDTSARDIMNGLVQREAFGKLTLVESEALVRLFIGDHEVAHPDRVVLVEPGTEIVLRAEMLLPADPGGGEEFGFEDVGFFRQTAHEEVFWEGEADDVLVPGRDGSVRWRAGSATGRPSYVTAEVARLEVGRTAKLASTPDAPAPASLVTGKAGVLLLVGVPFDRNGDGILQGQNIGIYPNESGPTAKEIISSRVQLYRPPSTFYRLDARSGDALVTRFLTLGELAPPAIPEDKALEQRFVAVSPRLVTFLLAFETKLEEQGARPEGLVVLRGFVSPTDRQRLARVGVDFREFTRFQYGDAVALALAKPAATEGESAGTPTWGDMNGDGKWTTTDVEQLAEIARQTMNDLDMWGGVGVVSKYEGPGPATGTPYLHVDLRGWYAPFTE